MQNTEPDAADGCRESKSTLHGAQMLQVAVGVVKNAHGQVLISLRDPALHQGGLWEFPGGKIEAGETVEQALARELYEELNIVVSASTPLIQIEHRYPDRDVCLHVRSVDHFQGSARQAHGQPLQWVDPLTLSAYSFPVANRPIVIAAQLPSRYAILDDADESRILPHLENLLLKGIRLIQARWKTMPAERIAELLPKAYRLCRQMRATLLVNSAMMNIGIFQKTVSFETQIPADGLHLTGRDLMSLRERPKGWRWLAASCHTVKEMQQAEAIDVDFIVLGSVLPTRSHPDILPLGWQMFTEWVEQINRPVFALGGMTEAMLPTAQHAGGQGICGISAF